MARAGAPRIARCEQNECRRMCNPSCGIPARRDARFIFACTNGRERSAVVLTEHARAPQVPLRTERRGQASSQRHASQAAAFRRGDDAVPVRPRHADLPIDEIDVAPLERHHLADAEPGLPAEEYDESVRASSVRATSISRSY
jgi:hypothetical protein